MPILDESQQQNSSRQHPVPQNVMDVEFKVVGDLTVRQLMYLFAAVSLGYLFHRSGLPTFWRTTLMIITGITGIAVAFVPIEERGLDKWLVSFIKALFAPSQRVWRKSYAPPAYFISDYAQIIKNEIITLTPAKSRSKLDDYLGQLPEYQTDLDKLEFSRLQDIKSGFGRPMATNIPQPIRQQPAMTPDLGLGSTTTVEIEEPEEEKPIPVSDTKPKEKDESDWIAYDEEEPKKEKKKTQPTEKELQAQKDRKEAEQHEIQSKLELLKAVEQSKPTFKSHAIDRAMVNLPSDLKGEIRIKTTAKLPKTIVFQDIKSIESKEGSLSKKVNELLSVTRQVRKEMQQHIAQGKGVQEVKQAHEGRVEFFKSKYKELEEEQAKITSQIDKSTTRVAQVDSDSGQNELKTQVQDLMQRNEELKAQLEQIKVELTAIKNPAKPIPQQPIPQQPQPVTKDIVKELDPDQQKHVATEQKIYQEPTEQEEEDPNSTKVYVQTQRTDGKKDQSRQDQKKTVSPFEYDPNVVHGIVKNRAGELVEGAVVIIKDKDGDAIRALKTNQLGQFKTQTPLQDGVYNVEAIKGGSKFDIISVEAKGEQLKPLQIIAYA